MERETHTQRDGDRERKNHVHRLSKGRRMSFVRVWKQCPSIRIMYGWSTRTVFPVLDSYVFMRSASASPISRGVRDDELAMTMEEGAIDAMPRKEPILPVNFSRTCTRTLALTRWPARSLTMPIAASAAQLRASIALIPMRMPKMRVPPTSSKHLTSHHTIKRGTRLDLYLPSRGPSLAPLLPAPPRVSSTTH